MPNIISLAYLTLFATLATTYAQTRFQKDTTPTRAVIIFTIEPVFAAILAYFLLRETLGTLGLLGGFLIICGVLLSEVSESIPFLNRALDGGDREAGPVS
jgi:drug/metabolite transporter (DMT)-like permease